MVNKKYCYFNGKITTLDKVKISPYDIGLLRGYGVFDVMCTQNGKPFLLDEHWVRLVNSAKELGIKVPVPKEKFREIVKELLKKNGHKKSTIRTVLTGGESSNGFLFESKPTFFVLIERFKALAKENFEKGASIITMEHKRDIPRAKITNYLRAIQKQGEKIKKKALEIVYVQGKNVLEASTSNLFVVKNGKIITTHEDVLHGITRNLAIKLARENGMEVSERKIRIPEFFGADEIFLTATNKDIVPVVRVDGKKIGDGRPGKVAKKVAGMFFDFTKRY